MQRRMNLALLRAVVQPTDVSASGVNWRAIMQREGELDADASEGTNVVQLMLPKTHL